MKVFILAGLLAGATAVASANVNTFDSFTEGFALSYTSNGVTVANLDRYLGTGPHEEFAIEQADGTLGGMSGFSPNNVLGFGGYTPGPQCAFTRLGTFDFSMASQASTASLDIFAFANDPNGTITLQGILGGNVVQSAIVAVPASFVVTHVSLSIAAGLYDSFHVISASPTNQGANFVVVDNVSVTPVPEPATIAGLGVGALALLRRRKH